MSGGVIPSLFFEQWMNYEETNEEMRHFDIHPGVLQEGADQFQENVTWAIYGALDDAWAALAKAINLASIYSQEVAIAWPDCWPRNEKGAFTTIYGPHKD